jgi:adenylosuccinate synthase
VSDLGFGDSGKGTVTEALVRKLGAGWVVRYNGGAQAGHNVVLEDGRFHTFSQFGAGTFVPGVRTFLSRFMVLHPGGLLEEARVLASKGVDDALERVCIDPRARVITPFHQAANRLREVLRGDARHGSCGLGVGETMHHSLECPSEGVVAGDLLDPEVLRGKLLRIQQRYWQEFSTYRRELLTDPLGAAEMAVLESSQATVMFLEQANGVAPLVRLTRPHSGTVIFEGAQGVLLDEWRGFHPYTTWSTCTFDNALELVRELGGGEVFRLGVVRSYATRHGAGPFPTEEPSLDMPEPYNRWGPWQQGFRLGWLDLPLLRYAVEACGGLDGLAVTHLDRVGPGWKLGVGYQGMDRVALGPFRDLAYQERLGLSLSRARPIYQDISGIEDLCAVLQELAPIVLTSWGPTAADKEWVGQLIKRHSRPKVIRPKTASR